MKYKSYLIGGAVRDRLLGLKSKDMDYSIVIENPKQYSSPEEAFNKFVKTIEKEGYEVFLKTPKCLTVRAKFPKDHKNNGIVADFVISRLERGYKVGTREPVVELGTLFDDCIRRDYSVNALAEDEDGNIIDFFNGQKDLQQKILRTPTDAAVSFNADPLRIIRGIRFAITKDFEFSDEIWRAIDMFDAKKMKVVSFERVMEELKKCFQHDTRRTIEFLKTICLSNYDLYNSILSDNFWLNQLTNNKMKNRILNSDMFEWFRKLFIQRIYIDISTYEEDFCCHVYSWHSFFICWKDLKEVKETFLESKNLYSFVEFSCDNAWFSGRSQRLIFLEEVLNKFK